ncbi:MAG: PAS domain S-box protein [Candidatus Hydrogenedentota bacterium]
MPVFRDRNRWYALLISAAYAVVGGLWILFSDLIISLIYTTPSELTIAQTYKGWFYVGATAIIGYFVVLWALRHRTAAVRAIQNSRNRIEAILETTRDGVWEIREGAVEYCSDSMAKFSGTVQAPRDNARAFFDDLIHPDDREAFQSRLRSLQTAPPDSFETEVRMRTETDEWRHVLIRAKCIERTKDGKAVRIVGSHTDITTLIATDEALKRANRIVQNSPAVLFRWRAKDVWPVVYVSDNVSQWGYTPEMFLSGEMQYADIIHSDDYPSVLAKTRKIEHEDLTYFQMEYRILTRANETRWVSEYSAIERDSEGFPTHYQGFVLDITDRQEAELALRESQQKYKALFEAANDAIFLMDGLQFIACNQRVSEIFGVPEEEIIGTTPIAFSTETQPDGTPSDECARHYVEAALAGNPQFFYWRHKRGNGEEFYTEISLNRVKLQDKYYVQAIVRDISERVRAEEEKNRLEVQLHQAQKMEAIGQLAGGIAHDFNNILQAIRGNADLAQQDLPQHSPALESLEEIVRASERGAALVNQLLAFSRRMPMQREPVNLANLVQDLTKMLQPLIGDDIELIVQCDEDLPLIKADVAQIQQVIINLCLNARDAMSEGGRIAITAQACELSDRFCARNAWAHPGTYVRLAVADTGSGIPAEARNHVFEPFFTTKEIGKGTGLGLATVYANVKRHNGFVAFESKPQKGTEFEIFLPINGEVARETEAAPVRWQPAEGSGTILLAEDDPLVRRLAVRVLENAGYRVFAAQNGEEALALFDKHASEINLLLLDVVMPKVHGPEVYEAIAKSGKALPVVFTTGYSDATLHWDTSPPSPVFLLEKPYPSSQLIKTVNQAMSKLRSAQKES